MSKAETADYLAKARTKSSAPKPHSTSEGPLGEWTGYYAGGKKREPAIRIETFWHRNDPVLLGAVPGMPPNDDTFYRGTYRCGAVWNQLEAAGIPEVKGVWSHEAGGSRLWLTVAKSRCTAATPSRPA